MEFGWVLFGSLVTAVTWIILLLFGSTNVPLNTMVSLAVTLIVGCPVSMVINARRGKTK